MGRGTIGNYGAVEAFLEEYLARLEAKGRSLEPPQYDILKELLEVWFG
jgi:hypothetical protein